MNALSSVLKTQSPGYLNSNPYSSLRYVCQLAVSTSLALLAKLGSTTSLLLVEAKAGSLGSSVNSGLAISTGRLYMANPPASKASVSVRMMTTEALVDIGVHDQLTSPPNIPSLHPKTRVA